MRHALHVLLPFLLAWSLTDTALARPEAPSVLCATYPDAATCRGRLAECTTCHTSTWPPAWNAFGLAVLAERETADFAAELPRILSALEPEDADGDGAVNLDELLVGTSPGDPADVWLFCPPSIPASGPPVADGFDFRRAFARVNVLYCGRSPTYDELAAFDGDGAREDELYLRLHARLDECLASAYWRDDGLARLADLRIRPLAAVGIDSPIGITVGDYEWDYRLFTYVLTGDRDARDLLLADYHVERLADGTLAKVEGTFPSPIGGAGGQPLEPARRAGMITTQWFLSINTMFSALPRTTAAQAYRAYLGLDIAKQQGLVPVAGEPVDVDRKGVTEPACVVCHSTLDPLSYAFASYNGITGPATGAYNASRPSSLMPDWADNRTVLFGQPVADVRAWAEQAVESDLFAQNLAHMFFRHALERDPTPGELPEVDAAWAALPVDGWSANRLIHHLVDTSAFGVAR